jgi:predicted dehydrogenase
MCIFEKNSFMKLRIGVLGAGHLGKIHLRLAESSPLYDLVGFYDPNQENAALLSQEMGYKHFAHLAELIEAVDVVDIVTPTLAHFEVAKQAITQGKHVFIEKPITHTLEQAHELIELAQTYGVLGQVGHVERFNPAFKAALSALDQPMFIETHRLAEFNPRGTDVPVVLDLMIHDIDIILSVVQSPLVEVRASGVRVLSQSPDIANARLVFENGCVANLTASRISMKNMRKSRFFQKDAYVSVDFLEKKTEVVKMKDAPEHPGPFDMILVNAEGVSKQIYFEHPTPEANNAIQDELETFAQAITLGQKPIVDLVDGANALDVALQIIQAYEK